MFNFKSYIIILLFKIMEKSSLNLPLLIIKALLIC